MSLFFTNFAAGVILFLFGCVIFSMDKVKASNASAWLRRGYVGTVLFLPGCVWFLTIIYGLGEADFGQYKNVLLLLFLTIFIYTAIYLTEWLSVRGMAIFALLLSRLLLDVNYMSGQFVGKTVALFAYLTVIAAMYIGVEPFRLRDFLNWAAASNTRAKFIAFFAFIYSSIIMISNVMSLF